MAVHAVGKVVEGCAAASSGRRTGPAAAKLRSALVAGLTTGTFVPPVRPDCIIRLLKPVPFGGPPCPGNCFVWVDAACCQLAVVMPHHKTARSAGPIRFRLPQMINDVAVAYFSWGHGLLADLAGQPGVQHAFFNSRGGALTTNYYATWWRQVLDVEGLTPQLCRCEGGACALRVSTCGRGVQLLAVVVVVCVTHHGFPRRSLAWRL
jgi:hypothetical protein